MVYNSMSAFLQSLLG